MFFEFHLSLKLRAFPISLQRQATLFYYSLWTSAISTDFSNAVSNSFTEVQRVMFGVSSVVWTVDAQGRPTYLDMWYLFLLFCRVVIVSLSEIREILLHFHVRTVHLDIINRLTPNDPYMGRTAPLTSKHCILCIYSTNIGTEYFKYTLYPPFFSLQNAVCFVS